MTTLPTLLSIRLQQRRLKNTTPSESHSEQPGLMYESTLQLTHTPEKILKVGHIPLKEKQILSSAGRHGTPNMG